MLEICGVTNSIAANYALSKDQHKALILSAIPTTSVLAKELKLLSSLDHIFSLASLNASSIHTKAELEAKLEGWHLNHSSYATLNESIGLLKTLIADAEDFSPDAGSQRRLYALMIRRIKRERLPASVHSNLEEARMRIENEYDAMRLHEIFLAAIKPVVIWKPKNLSVHQLLLGNGQEHNEHVKTSADFQNIAMITNEMRDGPKKEGKKKNKNPNKEPQENKSVAKVNQIYQKDNKQAVDNNPQKKGTDGGDNKSRSGARPRFRTVLQWPENVSYHSKNGNKISKECEKHFQGHCYKCGHSSHKSDVCQIYPEKTTILTLCNVCRSGFHDTCRSYKYAKKSEENKAIKKLSSLLESFGNKPFQLLQQQAPHFQYPFSYPFYAPPPQPPQLTHGPHVTESEEEE